MSPTAYGVAGVLTAAAVVFFAYSGFEAVANLGEETENPGRDMPRGLIGTLATCTVLYLLVALAEMVSIGTPFAFVVVAIAVPVLRRTEPKMDRPFKTPQVPLLPIITALACFALMANLAVETW
ncbi:MAG: amino acid permease, partial [Marmoricola sp.]